MWMVLGVLGAAGLVYVVGLTVLMHRLAPRPPTKQPRGIWRA